ncbi:hypothetical protein [[Mycobacterium] crassicus]|uniref:Uncharacterized protein n=1 Tax=[Mycobacterium] crassicus TaxID=2872309 RepID=A0ABU5XRY2_9MYCO|nr:hypothetical protein [Mycolicibacter sp. MYC098]MEB3024062.1 hypothetical protein [Mycolicibacter sp. MYC098]
MKNPLALGIALVGCLAMSVATFIPLYESSRFARIEQNTLIQHGGWMLILAAIGIAASAYRYDQGMADNIAAPVGLSVLAGVLLFFAVNDKSDRTLYPVGFDGNPITDAPGTVAALGVGVYLAGAGIFAALAGSVMMWQTRQATAEGGSTAGKGQVRNVRKSGPGDLARRSKPEYDASDEERYKDY